MAPFDPPSFTSQSSHESSVQSDAFQQPSDSSHLRPEDAFYASPPHKVPRQRSPLGRSDTSTAHTASYNSGTGNGHGSGFEARRRRDKHRGRSGSGRRKTTWKKLLWVKQSYPDNYTDEETFLDHLQRNPSLRPYEFWPLVADSTIIVQHVCSVIIFVCSFTAIFQERISPKTVIGWATTGTVLGWVLRDYWVWREEGEDRADAASAGEAAVGDEEEKSSDSSSKGSFDATLPLKDPPAPISSPPTTTSFANGVFNGPQSRSHPRNMSTTSMAGMSTPVYTGITPPGDTTPIPNNSTYTPPYGSKPSPFSPRMQERLATAKSAILIYCSLLGLSPILKSLTKSTSSDSIWALSSLLMGINVFFFDYGAGPEAKFPASLSTNAALMASTVLASRLPSTAHVFSLTLFSIEVFGLFPVFRRHLRTVSWVGHLLLTCFLVVLASGGLSIVISGGGWGYGVLGVLLGGVVTCLSMGVTSWWLIGLQRYKNEIHGPWDPARPVIRRHWE